MRRSGLVGGCAALCFAVAAQAQGGSLPGEVEQALRRAQVPLDAVSVVVQEVGAATPRLAFNAQQPRNPASLMKLLTTYAALDMLGPAWQWSTPVWLVGKLEGGVLDGSLVIQGRGDPKLVVERLWLLLRRVQQLGVREIRGDIVLDQSMFETPPINPAEFDNEPLRPYNVRAQALLPSLGAVIYTFTPDAARGVAVVSAEPALAGVVVDATVPLSNAACGDWRGGLRASLGDAARTRFAGSYPLACGEKSWPTAFAEPGSYTERIVEALWRDGGGKLGGRVRNGQAPSTPPSFEFGSPPLADVVRDINKYSNNVMAQQLFLTLGLQATGRGTPLTARAALRDWMQQRLGEGPQALDGLVIDNGSGLSRETRLSAALLAKLLQSAWGSSVMPELMSSLPISGLDGTLRRSRAPLGRAHLKTGSLRDVAGVAGYVLGAGGRRFVLVALANDANAGAARPAFDALVQWTMGERRAVTIDAR